MAESPSPQRRSAAKDDEPASAVVERYPASEWRERSGQVGASPHAIAGALYGVAADEPLSVDEVRSKVEAFLKHEAEVAE